MNSLSKGWNVGNFTKMPPGTAVQEVGLLVRGGGSSGVVDAAGGWMPFILQSLFSLNLLIKLLIF